MSAGNDAMFENIIDKFSAIEKDPNKNVDEVQLKETTTWEDLGWAEANLLSLDGCAPDLRRGYKVRNTRTGDIHNVLGADEKYVHTDGPENLPVGDAFVYSNEWELIGPDGDKVQVDRRETDEAKVKEGVVDKKKEKRGVLLTGADIGQKKREPKYFDSEES